MSTTCPAHLIFLDVINLILCGITNYEASYYVIVSSTLLLLVLQFKISSSENQSYKKHKKGRERKKDMRAV
jgi:hypothetical protein